MRPERNLSHILERKRRLTRRLFESRSDRERLVRLYKGRCLETPSTADAALVLGTSLELYKDKFKKRVFTAVKLAEQGRVPRVIFSGKINHETNDTDQAADAKRVATAEFGLTEERIHTVGGNNTRENLIEARKLLTSIDSVRDLYLVSNAEHLMRTNFLADYVFEEHGVKVYPFPTWTEAEIDPDSPKVILEALKTVLYNRLLNKNDCLVTDHIIDCVDGILKPYADDLRQGVEKQQKLPFEEWKKRVPRIRFFYN